MNCPLQSEDTLDLLLDYAAGRLDPARSAVLEHHMELCACCAAFRTEQKVLWNALDEWEPEPVSPSFNRTLWQRIDAVAGEPWYRRCIDALRFGGWKPAFPLAAAACVVTAGFLLDHTSAPKPRVSVMTSGVSVAEVDQLEKTLDDIQLLRQLDSASHADTN